MLTTTKGIPTGEALEKINKLYEEFEEKRKVLVAEIQANFFEIWKPIFDEIEGLTSISWKQYTPYFNDGDECTFSAHINYPDINGGTENYLEDFYEGERIPKASYALVVALLKKIPEDVYKDLFGDHVKVTMHKEEGVTVEGYDHD